MPFRLSNKIPLFCAVAAIFGTCGCERKPQPEPKPTEAAPPQPAEANVAVLGRKPDWSALDGFQGSMTRAEFERLLNTVFAMPRAYATTLTLEDAMVKIRRDTSVSIMDPNGTYDLKFGSAPATAPRYWRKRSEIPPSANSERPLEGVRIAIDPGHIGGAWAIMEERNFQPETGPPIREGDHTLQTAKLLKPMLESLGATVSLVRNAPEPVTKERPGDFIAQARKELEAIGINPDEPSANSPMHTVRWQSEKLFYRTAEIRARAALVNQSLKPDFVICLHFNASGDSWGVPGKPNWSTENHLHMLLNGGYGFNEIVLDDQRFEMLLKLLSGVHDEELGLGRTVGNALARASGLPPFTYTTGAMPIPGQPYLWSRNLLANRLYACPVIYCEPYVMNHRHVAARLQAGDFEGEKEILGIASRSIFREYAEGIAVGLREYFSDRK